MATIDRAAYTVSVKATGKGKITLAFEPIDTGVSALRRANLALDLKPGATRDQAEELARAMRNLVYGVAVTRFDV